MLVQYLYEIGCATCQPRLNRTRVVQQAHLSRPPVSHALRRVTGKTRHADPPVGNSPLSLLYLVPRLSSRQANIGAIGHVGCLESGRSSFQWIPPAAVYDDEGRGVMSFDHDAYRAQSLATWGEMATGWEDRRDWMMNIAGQVDSWLVTKTDPQPGQNFLDIAAGAGDLSIAVVECVGGGGHVISSDFSPKMIDVARRNGLASGLASGLANIEYRVMDAEEMELGDNSVDGVVCRWDRKSTRLNSS